MLFRSRLRGLPHAVFDVGFGLCLMSVALLAAYYGDRRLYLLLLPAVVLLGLIQRKNYLPEERVISSPEELAEKLRAEKGQRK